MSDRLSEFSSQAGLGIFNAHPYKCPDSEDVTQPVAVRIAVGNFKPTAYDDREARGTHNYDVTVQWTDPRGHRVPSSQRISGCHHFASGARVATATAKK